MKFLQVQRKRKISLEEIEKELKPSNYLDLYQFVMKKKELEILQVIKSSPLNGKRPSLHTSYWIMPEKKDYSNLIKELHYHLHQKIQIGYYLANLNQYEKDREAVLKLSHFLTGNHLEIPASLNERAFQVWQQEKFFQLGSGQRILKNVGLLLTDLNIYQTAEPIAYYSRHKNQQQNVIIIENKDTFFTLRKYLIENSTLFGMDIGTLIYGGGKKVSKAFSEFELSVEPYLVDSSNRNLSSIKTCHEFRAITVENSL